MRCWIPGSAMREQLAEVWRVFRRQRAAAGGLLALAVIVVASPSIVVLSRIDPEAISADVLGRPSLAHAMGTDYLGRDILGRVLHGVNTSLLVGASVAAIALCIGLVLGTAAGFYRGSIDHIIMRAADGLLIVPTFFLVLAVAFIFGGRLTFVIVMLGLTTWPQIARIVRAEVLALKEEAFVQSARALGAGDLHLMFREILPNTLPPVVAMIALLGSSAILAEASLSFLRSGDLRPRPAPQPARRWAQRRLESSAPTGGCVRFSIAINMMRRRPDVPMETVAAQALEMVVAAERLGFDIAWAAEHHTIEYTIAPNPLVLIVH